MASRNSRGSTSGQSLVELAFILPLLLLIIANVVNFGGLFYASITVATAARHASQYWVIGGATIGAPGHAEPGTINALITQDIAPLPNSSSLALRVCQEDKAAPGTPACTTFGSGSFSNPALDSRAEAGLFAMAWVDVQYTYQPYIPLFSIAGIPLTTTPQTINRQSVMRMLQ